jgi:hypothetical protein
MNVNEELDDEQMFVKNPQRLSAAVRKQGRDVLEDSKGERFDFDAIEKASYSDGEVIEPVREKAVSFWHNMVSPLPNLYPVQTKRQKKQLKGELRNDIDSREAKLWKMEVTVRVEGRNLINETVADSDTMWVDHMSCNSGLYILFR